MAAVGLFDLCGPYHVDVSLCCFRLSLAGVCRATLGPMATRRRRDQAGKAIGFGEAWLVTAARVGIPGANDLWLTPRITRRRLPAGGPGGFCSGSAARVVLMGWKWN